MISYCSLESQEWLCKEATFALSPEECIRVCQVWKEGKDIKTE